jgi:putative transposase
MCAGAACVSRHKGNARSSENVSSTKVGESSLQKLLSKSVFCKAEGLGRSSTLSCMRKTYPTDLSEKEWACLKTHLPASKLPSRLRAHFLRDIFDAIFYVLRSGCPWRLLPHDFPPWSTVYYHFRRFRLSGLWHRTFTILRAVERKRAGKDFDASAAIIDSQSVKTTEESAGSNGYEAHKNVKGRKRHLLVDTLGFPFSVCVTPANVQDRAGARLWRQTSGS